MKHLERLEEINAEIASIEDARDLKNELETHLSILDLERSRLNARINKLFAYLDKERKEFEVLETLSIVPLFFKVLGVYEGRYEKGRIDFVEAALNYNAALDQLHLIDFELKIVKKKLSRLASSGKNMDALLKEKQDIFNVYDADTAREIGKFDTNIFTARRRKSLAYNLIFDANKILEDLAYIQETVKSTGIWVLKYQDKAQHLPYQQKKKIKLASRAATRTQLKLNGFIREINEFYPEKIEGKILIKDYLKELFSNLVKDWVAHYYFKSSEKSLSEDIIQLEGIRDELEAEIGSIKRDLMRIAQEKKDFLIEL